MNSIEDLQGIWQLKEPTNKGRITHWEIYEDTVTEAGPESSDPKPTRRIKVADNQITLVEYASMSLEKGFFRLNGNELEISLGHTDSDDPIKPDRIPYYSFERVELRPSFFVHRPIPFQDDILGEITWDGHFWQTKVKVPPPIRTLRCSIYERHSLQTNLERLRAFVAWLREHTEEFVWSVAEAAVNTDLMWDSVDDAVKKLRITDANALEGAVGIVVEPKRAKNDEHLIHATLDSEYQIIDIHD